LKEKRDVTPKTPEPRSGFYFFFEMQYWMFRTVNSFKKQQQKKRKSGSGWGSVVGKDQ
jgi:hypothetical protein